MADNNNLELPLWFNIVFWIVTAIHLLGSLVTLIFVSGSRTSSLKMRLSKFNLLITIFRVISYLSIIYFPAVLIWFYTQLYINNSKTLF